MTVVFFKVPFLDENTCDVLWFLKRNAFPFVHLLAQVYNRISHPREISISIDFVRHKTKRLSSVDESRGPVIASLFRVRFVRMIKVQVSGLS